ncbi:MAG: hypothetical protein R3B84_01955 [Zavarzinella sp.]
MRDIQVRWFAESDVAAIHKMIETEPNVVYQNDEGQTVVWVPLRIVSIEPLTITESGLEVIGFTTTADELANLIHE